MLDWPQCVRPLASGAALLCAAAMTAPGVFAAPVLEVTRLGPPTIAPEQRYAEITRFRIVLRHGAGHPRAGRVVTSFRGNARVEEWRTTIYDGAFGATALPMRVSLDGGTGRFALRSLARYKMIAQRGAPVPEIAVYAAGRMQRLQVPQWVDANDDGRIDWLAQQVRDILKRASASDIQAVRAAVRAVDGWRQSWRRDCGGVLPKTPTVIRIGAACLNSDGMNMHRFDYEQGLTATILHEARHVWAYRHPARAGLPRILDELRGGRARCQRVSPAGCPDRLRFQAGVIQRHETDAEAFAQRHKDRVR